MGFFDGLGKGGDEGDAGHDEQHRGQDDEAQRQVVDWGIGGTHIALHLHEGRHGQQLSLIHIWDWSRLAPMIGRANSSSWRTSGPWVRSRIVLDLACSSIKNLPYHRKVM